MVYLRLIQPFLLACCKETFVCSGKHRLILPGMSKTRICFFIQSQRNYIIGIKEFIILENTTLGLSNTLSMISIDESGLLRLEYLLNYYLM